MWCEGQKTFTKITLSQRVFEISRDFEFFCRQKFQPVFLGPATSADRPAKLAESAIFWRKCEKHDLKSTFHKMAGNGRICSKKNWVNLLTVLFSKKTFFSKKVAQLQKYLFLAKFDLFSAIFQWIGFRPSYYSGKQTIFSEKIFAMCLNIIVLKNKKFFEKKLTNFKILRFFGFFHKIWNFSKNLKILRF